MNDPQNLRRLKVHVIFLYWMEKPIKKYICEWPVTLTFKYQILSQFFSLLDFLSFCFFSFPFFLFPFITSFSPKYHMYIKIYEKYMYITEFWRKISNVFKIRLQKKWEIGSKTYQFFPYKKLFQTSCLKKSLVLKWFYGLEQEKNIEYDFCPHLVAVSHKGKSFQ